MEEKNTDRNIIGLLIAILAVLGIAGGLFTNFKQETLICSKSLDFCKTEKINLLNMKSQKQIAKFSEIAEVGYFREKIKGNRYSKGYSDYLLTFVLKNNNSVVIFKSAYYNKSELQQAIKTLSGLLENSDDEIIFTRN